MATRQTAAQKAKAVVRHECGSCGEIFTGRVCPNCAEENNIFRINRDDVRVDDVANAVGATHSLPIVLQRSPDDFDAAEAMEDSRKQELRDVINNTELDKARTRAVEQAAKRLRAENELKATEDGFMPPKEGGEQQQSGMGNMSSAIFMQALGGWNPEAREMLFDRLKADPEFAFNLSRLLNPQPGMPQMGGMMNPMAMMGGMMQQPVEQAPPINATEMITAMISGMTALKELSGSDGNSSAQMERLLDKMDEMRKETENLKLQLAEAESKPSESLTTEDIRRIVSDAMSGATTGKMGLLNGLQEIHAVADELTDLGIVQKPSAGVDPEQALEERKFNHQVKMDDKREQREHEINLRTEEAEVAKANAKEAFVSGLFAGAQEHQTNIIDDGESDTSSIGETVEVEPRHTAVIS